MAADIGMKLYVTSEYTNEWDLEIRDWDSCGVAIIYRENGEKKQQITVGDVELDKLIEALTMYRDFLNKHYPNGRE